MASSATSLNYMSPTTKVTRYLGLPKLQFNILQSVTQLKALVGLGLATQPNDVKLHDARSANLSYEEVGFSLQRLESKVEDWVGVSHSGSPSNELYKSELEAVVKKLHPTVEAIEFSTFLLRGGEGENGPATGAVHLDYFPDGNKLMAHLDKCECSGSSSEIGYNDFSQNIGKHPQLQLGMILGLWKPRNSRDPVSESPLIMCDPSTIDSVLIVPQEQDFVVKTEGTSVRVVNLAANLKYSERQKWWFFSHQTRDELTVFRHFTPQEEGQKLFANFHCAAKLPLREGMEARSSVETRAFLFFKKES